MPIQWQSCYGGSNNDKATDIIIIEDGYLMVGTVNSDDGDITNFHGETDLWVVKTDSLGTILWERCYGGTSQELEGRIIKDFLGNYYICGWTSSDDGDVQSFNHGSFDVWIIKINETGDILWENCFGGSGYDEPTNFNLLTDGNILITCNSTSDDGDLPAHYGFYDSWIFIISPEGEIVQSEVFGNDLNNTVNNAIETQDGGYFFTSKASSTNGMVEGTYHGGMTDVWVVKLDNLMNIEWQMLYGGGDWDSGSNGIIELIDGYLFLALTNSNDGDVSGFHGGFRDIWAVKTNFDGEIIWQKCLGGSDSETAGDVFQLEDQGFIIFGTTDSNNGDVSGNHSWSGYSDIWMVKLNSAGEIEWQQCYGGLNDELLYSGIVKKTDYNWVLAGSTKYNTGDVVCNWHGLEDYWVFEIKDPSINIIDRKISEQGIKIYPNPANEYLTFDVQGSKCKIANSYTEIQIVDVFGKEIACLPLNPDKTVWGTSNVSNGIYFYTIKFNDKLYMGKVLVQK